MTIAVCVLQIGCATIEVPPAISSAQRENLGVVAIVPAQFVPDTKFIVDPNYRQADTAQSSKTGELGPALMIGSGLPFNILGGFLAGAQPRFSMPAGTATEVESVVRNAVVGADVQTALAGWLATLVKSEPAIRLGTVSAAGPHQPAARPDYAPLRTAGIDTVLEVAVTEIGFAGCVSYPYRTVFDCFPLIERLIHLFVRAQVRLVRVADGAVLLEWQFHYQSGKREIAQWVANGGKSLGEDLEHAYGELAQRIYDVVFLFTPIELPSSGRYAWIMGESCWLAPVYPAFGSSSTVDTLRPTLRWSAFPRELDREKLDPAVLRKIGNVTYDLRIWREEGYNQRGRLFYERAGLAAPEHTMEVSLAPASHYHWSVRARFVFDGRPMSTRWGARYVVESTCFWHDIPAANYHRFETPKQDREGPRTGGS